MAKLSERENLAVRNSLVRLAMLARYSLTPSQTRVAKRGVGELLWLLGIDEVHLDGIHYVARAPQGDIIEADGLLQLEGGAPHG